MKFARHVARMGKGEVHTKFWPEKPEGKVPRWRTRRRWDDNFKMDL